MNEAKPLMLGAASLIGDKLLPLAASADNPVLAVSRKDRHGPPGVEWVRADLEDDAWIARLGPVSVVYSLQPIWLLPPLIPALAAKGARRCVAVSSTSRFTKGASSDALERAVAARLEAAEAAAFSACAAFDVGLTILRPTLVYAEGRDANVTRLARMISRFGVVPIYGDGSGLRQPVHAEDVAQACLAAEAAAQTRGRAYDLPGGETLSYRTMVERIFDALGRKRRVVSLPPWLWRAAFALARPILPNATMAMGERMLVDLTFDPDPARRDLQWAPRAFHPRFPPAG